LAVLGDELVDCIGWQSIGEQLLARGGQAVKVSHVAPSPDGSTQIMSGAVRV
jgi:hypothetical protein